jgi:hypothetical protein
VPLSCVQLGAVVNLVSVALIARTAVLVVLVPATTNLDAMLTIRVRTGHVVPPSAFVALAQNVRLNL